MWVAVNAAITRIYWTHTACEARAPPVGRLVWSATCDVLGQAILYVDMTLIALSHLKESCACVKLNSKLRLWWHCIKDFQQQRLIQIDGTYLAVELSSWEIGLSAGPWARKCAKLPPLPRPSSEVLSDPRVLHPRSKTGILDLSK